MNKTESNSQDSTAAVVAGNWSNGTPPANVKLGQNTVLTGELAFKRFHSIESDALIIGNDCTMDDVHFDLGKNGRLSVGNYCYFTYTVLLCELEIRIGNYVVIGWNTTVADTDFHPIAPAERIADALACSPLGKGRARPAVLKRPVIIEDDVWIGPNATILKGVRIGAGSWIEAGSVVTRDVPPRSRIVGNPAQIIGESA
jgi:acetyltransferase-like isoleucine patch superfamily enzyme